MSADFTPLIIITVSVTLNVPYSSFKLKASENNETVRANLQKKPNSGFFLFFFFHSGVGGDVEKVNLLLKQYMCPSVYNNWPTDL